jgi:hypothetical protein
VHIFFSDFTLCVFLFLSQLIADVNFFFPASMFFPLVPFPLDPVFPSPKAIRDIRDDISHINYRNIGTVCDTHSRFKNHRKVQFATVY